jgi:hypothetical protein
LHITIAGLGGFTLLAITVLAVLLLGLLIGFVWAGKRRYMAHRDEFEAECEKRTLALDEREFLQTRKQEELNGREERIVEREDALDDRDRDLCGQEAEMDQRQAALAERELRSGATLS